MTDDAERSDRTLAATVGATGLAVMILTPLVWDPALTLPGAGAFGIADDDSVVVRSLLKTHP